jgi:non-specific serine/threonine protein kinase
LARESGDLQRAVALFTQCLELCRAAGDEWDAANALHNLGHVMLALADVAQGRDYFRQALEVRLRLGNVLGIAECLEGFAAADVNAHPARATRLLGAAAGLREHAGAPVPAAEQARYAQLVERARGGQSADAFAAAWAQGRALNMLAATDLALSHLSAPAPEDDAPRQPALRRLTPREHEIAGLIALGYSNREIASTLVLGIRTVETHLEHVFRKLHVQSRAEVAVWVVQNGLMPIALTNDAARPIVG